MTVCVQYAKPSSGQVDSEVYGLDVAVNNLLSAWFRYGTQDKFVCRPVDIPSYENFVHLAKAVGVEEARCVGLDPRTPQHNLAGISCLFRPDPLVAPLMWQRQQLRPPGYAVCGLVHTMSGERIAKAVSELCLSPAGVGDALICPSIAIKDAVQNLWGIYGEYLNHHFGGNYRCPIETPVIPLGVDTEKFTRLTTPEKRTAQRAALGVTDDEIVILFLGRLSFATKAHPLALWQAAERAAQTTRRKLRVVMFGYFKPKDMEPHFRNLAAEIGKQAQIEFIMNDDPRFPEGLWAGADIFTSLSDNIQESFGLTPVEAMAAGLPAVVSDWNGYRGGVREGQEGYLIPTYAPPPETGFPIAEHYYNEQNYGVALVGAAQSTALDVARCAEALSILANDDAKRRAMGESGRVRVRDVYDWKHVIAAYEKLWIELAMRRASAPYSSPVPKNWQAAHPNFPNPWQMFASFPSRHLALTDRIRVVMGAVEIDMLMKHEMNFFVPDLLMPKQLLLNLVDIIAKAGTPPINDLCGGFPPADQARVWRCVGWMLKLGICELMPEPV